jgi:ubiquinone/menaquinone biosynthesis C-methylase UbiE
VSWPEPFADCYHEWSATMTEDVPFYVSLAVDTAGPLVELAVGSGRVAIPVALATGRTVIGVDSSPAMLAQARTAATDAGVALDLREGDMRDLELAEPAGLVYCPYRALLHLPTWADRRRVFERVARSLRPGGEFAWNVSPSIITSPPGRTASARTRPSRITSPTTSPTTASTSGSTTAARPRCGGRRRTSGSG